MTESEFEDDFGNFLRPFLVTTGRTEVSVDGLRYETLVHSAVEASSGLRFESAKIFGLCQEPIALAEIAAELSIPIGTVKVLVSDLIENGHLALHDTIDATKDLDLISRLIEGVRRL